ncbi:RluA family pseudouridine synthase [Parvimonas micra]|uniref:RluA family pseudouridine synthase n=1 Tax=Parvimonas micra TaxID=33033 RepID=UPI002003DF23|nr:RluA family pseudouridine synthase [Parvimonas micra]MCK6129704.1 RluA family pseudouridine synthase [Parvimonas micra]MCK6135350.1 RluA family pseudouridine synthase [Parvimonas micra]MCK6136822.1 RluA family pseudouridine synthase [Parvimonas micra]MCK6153349.1 RluA family pseudouridine synthase [Parvimonas micra]
MTELKYISDKKIRCDVFLSEKISNLSRTSIQKLIKEKLVFVNGKNIKPNVILEIGDEITVSIPDKKEITLVAEDIALNIVYEDDYIIIINKPRNMVVHPAAGNEEHTLVNALLNHCKLSMVNSERPGIVHRLDKDTTGLIICAKDDETHLKLVEMFSNREINKKYLAICNGSFSKENGFIDKPIGRDEKDRKKISVKSKSGKEALTEYNILTSNLKYSLVDVTLHTGRTHQIRVHFSSLNHPIVGDETYGNKNEKIKANGQMLHSYYLEFLHPITKKNLSFTVLPDEYFFSILNKTGLEFNEELLCKAKD